MKMKCCTFIFLLFSLVTLGQQKVLFNRSIHLRYGRHQEWSSFPVHAKDSQLVIRFNAKDELENSISITQFDVNHQWNVILNNNNLGALVLDEKKLVTILSVPPGLLKKNNNTLIVRPETTNDKQSDDIRVGKIILNNSSSETLLTESSLNIHVKDDAGINVPCRLTITDQQGTLQPLKASGDSLAIRTGVIYSGTGNFSFSLPAGTYKVYASRGFEYGVDSALILAKPKGSITKSLKIEHEVLLKEWVSCDPHVHTLEYSGHGDALMKERIITIAGEGLDYAVITEHNKAVNITEMVKNLGMDKWFTPITGDELTTKVGHFNVFPASPDSVPSANVSNWKQVQDNLGKLGANKVIIFNHLRDIHNGFRPSDSLLVTTPGEFPANAMEVVNSGSQQTNPRQLYLDWMALLNRGIILTPVGSSDSHDVSRFVVGQARTYVRNDGPLDQNFLKGRVGVSFGLFTTLKTDTVAKDGKINVSISIYSPSWVKPGKISLFSNGERIFFSRILNKRNKGLVASYSFKMPKPAHPIILTAIAEGPGIDVPWWPISKPYQHQSPDVNPIVLGISGALKIN